ncbi:hypothetical protein AB1Y20_002101 [Prymnesium parvum]|uniref:Enoyl reductase (ER) domain-containing protein n=1 Tax=Prymnesium parvum TaxID=97485 RepID=A0AB34ID67_PRYPA
MISLSPRPSAPLLALALRASAALRVSMRSQTTAATDESALMSGIAASAFGLPSAVLRLHSDLPQPPVPPGKMLLRTAACSLSPGDWRMLSGDASAFKYPAAFPYVPGLDVCGEVVHAVPPFAAGDFVIATWGGAFGVGGLAQYSVVDPALAVQKPAGMGCVEGAALANSAGRALKALRAAAVKPGDRLLILGGSGGVGTAAIQLARTAEFNVSFLAATSSDTALLRSLGVDRPVNYSSENWYDLPEFHEAPFDVIIDCAVGVAAWRRANVRSSVLRRGGRWLAVVHNEWHIRATSIFHLFPILLPPLGRMRWSKICSPFGANQYIMYLGGLDRGVMSEVIQLAEGGQLKAVIDPSGPFPFTSEGGIAAFDLLRSRRTKGKIVVSIE